MAGASPVVRPARRPAGRARRWAPPRGLGGSGSPAGASGSSASAASRASSARDLLGAWPPPTGGAASARGRRPRAPGSRSSSASGSNVSAAPPARAATSSSAPASSASGTADLELRLGLRLALGAGRPLPGALDRGVGDERAEEADRPDRVVVGRDDVVELVGVDVRVAGPDDRDLELVGLGHRDPLAVRVDDEDGAREALHLAHAAERQRGACASSSVQLGGFLLGHPLEVAGLLARLELLEQPDPLLDRHEVGEHAAEPALVDVRLVRRASPPGRSAPGPASSCRRTGLARRGRPSRGRSRGRRPAAGRSGRGR